MSKIRETEETFLGTLFLCEDDILHDIFSQTKKEFFSFDDLREIYKRAYSNYYKYGSLSFDVIHKQTENIYRETEKQIMKNLYGGDNWAFYHGEMKKNYFFRSFKQIVNQYNPSNAEVALEAINNTINDLSECLNQSSKTKIITMKELCNEAIKTLETNYENKGKKGVSFGIEIIDSVLNEVKKEYYIISARPSIGKSALALQIGMSIARQGIPTLYFSYEMSAMQVAMRHISDLSNINVGNLHTGFFKKEDTGKLYKSVEKMSQNNFSIIDQPKNRTVQSMERDIRRAHAVDGVQCFIIDHVSLLTHENARMPRHEQFISISNIIQRLQRELDITIFVVMQLGRGAEGKDPSISDLKESSAFEQDADVVMIIDRKREIENTENGIETKLVVIKNRNGALSAIPLVFEPQFTRFRG